MTLNAFDDHWRYVMKRTEHGVMTVQNREELEHIYNLAEGSTSYLEVGTAEGNSLYVMAHAVKYCLSIDYGEDHTKQPVYEITRAIKADPACGNVAFIHGNSHAQAVIAKAQGYRSFDCVLIDAGHTYEDVIADAMAYGGLANKYLFFHDVKLPAVKKAVDWYVAQQGLSGSYHEFIQSEQFGYGVITLC